MIMNPETDPENPPAISAQTDQKELCERYSAPAPPASTTLAKRALCTLEPKARNTPASPSPIKATPHRPMRLPARRVSQTLTSPPRGQHAAIARKGSVP